MKIVFLFIGALAGYILKDLLTKESEVIYHIKKLRAKKGGEVTVDADATVIKPKQTRRERRKNKK